MIQLPHAECIQDIIESKYTPANLEKIVEGCIHLSKEEQRQLLNEIQKFENLIDGTLDTWKTEPVGLELKDPNVNLITPSLTQWHILKRINSKKR
jgi:hypothetical protein